MNITERKINLTILGATSGDTGSQQFMDAQNLIT